MLGHRVVGDLNQEEFCKREHRRLSSLKIAKDTNVAWVAAFSAISAQPSGRLVFETKYASRMGETRIHLLR